MGTQKCLEIPAHGFMVSASDFVFRLPLCHTRQTQIRCLCQLFILVPNLTVIGSESGFHEG